jgi:alpha-glucosidase
MKLFPRLLGWGALLTAFPVCAQKNIQLASPDGNIVCSFSMTDSIPAYTVSYRGKKVVDRSTLSLSFQDEGGFGKTFGAGKPVFRDGVDDYTLLVGKTSRVFDHYREVDIPLKGRHLIHLLVRVFNDGLAFRYVFPPQADWASYVMTDENTRFNLVGDPMALVSFLPDFTSSFEQRYSHMPLSAIKADTLIQMPVLFQYPDHVYLAITEAELVDYAGMSLIKHGGVLKSQLTPLPGQALKKVKGKTPGRSPWRVMLLSDRPGALIESNILTSLNEPCTFKDTSWIKPGKTDFHWWNGDVSPDTNFAPGINFDFNKYYIDFCAASGLQYHTVIGYANRAWYKNDAPGYEPDSDSHTDVLTPVPGLDMQQICDYAGSKGVDIRVWVHWQALYPQLEKAFTQFEKWGIKGMMVDFLNRDDQDMVNIQVEILQRAAAHHLHIQFHGAYKPTGLSRTYPNEFTREGTLNYENDKWGNLITPDDDISIPFTRLLAGATDYHLGGFHAIPEARYKEQVTRPFVLGTRCHMLAMYVVLESYLGMVCDYPGAYLGQPGFEFIQQVPTVWDETRVPAADVGAYVCIARRKGRDWYLGAINNSTARDVTVPLAFLPNGTYTAVIYSDAVDVGQYPDHLDRQTRTVVSKDTLTLRLASGGGQAIYLKRN